MAFERFNINRGRTDPFTPRPPRPLQDMPNAGRGNGFPQYTGPDLPGMGGGTPPTTTPVSGTPWTPPAFGSGSLGGSGAAGPMGGGGGGGGNGLSVKQRLEQAFGDWRKNNPNGSSSVFAPWGILDSKGMGGGKGRNPKPVTNTKPPVTGTPTNPTTPPGQWGNPTAPFPQNPYDVPRPLQPANNPWLASLPQRDWMTMPSASPGYDQAPPPVPWRPPY